MEAQGDIDCLWGTPDQTANAYLSTPYQETYANQGERLASPGHGNQGPLECCVAETAPVSRKFGAQARDALVTSRS